MKRKVAWPSVETVEECDSVHTCLEWNRFLPSPSTGDQAMVVNAVVERLAVLRSRDPAAYVQASKALGWD